MSIEFVRARRDALLLAGGLVALVVVCAALWIPWYSGQSSHSGWQVLGTGAGTVLVAATVVSLLACLMRPLVGAALIAGTGGAAVVFTVRALTDWGHDSAWVPLLVIAAAMAAMAAVSVWLGAVALPQVDRWIPTGAVLLAGALAFVVPLTPAPTGHESLPGDQYAVDHQQ
ncbi:hypothetical protein FOS14_15865 [Skermania sp. ID1734]|uniref:hypothetical protein n=1 Tax=Skermania sp. ID1734 TaxID=2597516 RepID=UPI001180AF74|nr:hypothetical protein [Skermania sp. ID1734]TSD96540.1 hypothetical protein FOS14_15865 [Skermania sp. ID1734]